MRPSAPCFFYTQANTHKLPNLKRAFMKIKARFFVPAKVKAATAPYYFF